MMGGWGIIIQLSSMVTLHIWKTYLKIWVNCCSGFTSYPQQGTKDVGSAPEMRKLANVLEPVSLFDFEGEILRQQREEPSIAFSPNTYRMKSYLDFGAKRDCFPYHRIAFSNNTDCVCFQFNWLFLMGTLLQETSDFNSTTKREQPFFFFFENNKKLSVMLGHPLHLNPHGGWSCTGMIRNAYGSSRSELAIICNDCKELPSFTWRKRFFFWGRTERTHPYNKIKHRKKRYLSMNYAATFSVLPKNT